MQDGSPLLTSPTNAAEHLEQAMRYAEEAPSEWHATVDASVAATREAMPPALQALWEGMQAARAKRWPEASSRLQTAIQTGLDQWQVHWLLAKAARQQGDVAGVERECSAVLARNPQFTFARELPKHVRGYYSQANQELAIDLFFKTVPPRHRWFAEVGAFDGVHYSNVRRLHEAHGWTGVSVEPVPHNYDKLKRSYEGTDVRCVQAACSNADGEMALHVSSIPGLPGWGSDTATLAPQQTSKHPDIEWRVETVAVRPLTQILDEAGAPGIDFLTVDAEGHDLKVLESLDFSKYRPKLIVVEAPSYEAERPFILKLLQGQGYHLVHATGQDLFLGTDLTLVQLRTIRLKLRWRLAIISLFRRLRSRRVDRSGFFLWS